jgi:hypothetical protein
MPRMAKAKKKAAPARATKKKAVPAARKKPAAAKANKKPAPAARKKPAAAKAKKKAAPAARKKAAPARAAKAPARTRGAPVDAYVARQGSWQKGVIAQLREILREGAPGATEELKGGHPVYDWNGPFAHIAAFPDAVRLGFWRGAAMSDPEGLLSGNGERMKHVEITRPRQVQRRAFVALVRDAVRLNDEHGDPTGR